MQETKSDTKVRPSSQQHYFQHQGWNLQCGLYCVNHLLGSRSYQPEDFKEICYQLSDDCINPHKHLCGGDYSIEVLMVALQRRGFDYQWHNATKQFVLDQRSETLGYIVNYKQGERRWYHKCFCLSARHWVIVKKVDNQYWEYDSGRTEPILLGKHEETQEKFRQRLEDEAEVIRIFKATSS